MTVIDQSGGAQIRKHPREETAIERWRRFCPIETGEQYVDSLRNRPIDLYMFGTRLEDPVEHPIVRPSINALKMTYDLATEDPELATAYSPFIKKRVNRFLHMPTSPDDLVMKNKMQRRMGQLTGTCFQRCAGLDAFSVLHSITFDIDQKHNTEYHSRYIEFLKMAQTNNIVMAAGMTDPKGDRSKRPHEQHDPDLFMHVSRRTNEGVYVRGAKAHITGGYNSHWIVVMPTMNLSEQDREFAIIGAVPIDATGLTFVYGRQSCDTRATEEGDIDKGNACYSGQETLIVFDDVFIPWEHVFMDGEYEFAQETVSRFTAYHRSSYVCKTGLGDVITGAAASIAEANGVESVSHIKDKIVEMVHLNETIYSSGIASSHEARQLSSGIFINDEMLSNICKHNVTRFPYEISRLVQDIAGGVMVTLPSDGDFNHEKVGPTLEKYFKGRSDISVEDRRRILRLIENMTLGRNAVGYLTESMHGAGSPQAQRIQIARGMNIGEKKGLANRLAGIAVDETKQSTR